MANKEKKIEGRLGYNSENGRYGFKELKKQVNHFTNLLNPYRKQ